MTEQNTRLAELVRTLDALGPRPSMIELTRAIEFSGLTISDVASFVQTNPRCCNRAPVVVREQYKMLVMTWLPGPASIPHDHNGSICVLKVLQGQAAEGCYRIAEDGFVDLQYEQLVETGEATSFDDAGVHSVRNASVDDETLMTLHVYAPPLRACRRFQPRPEGNGLSARPGSGRASDNRHCRRRLQRQHDCRPNTRSRQGPAPCRFDRAARGAWGRRGLRDA